MYWSCHNDARTRSKTKYNLKCLGHVTVSGYMKSKVTLVFSALRSALNSWLTSTFSLHLSLKNTFFFCQRIISHLFLVLFWVVTLLHWSTASFLQRHCSLIVTVNLLYYSFQGYVSTQSHCAFTHATQYHQLQPGNSFSAQAASAITRLHEIRHKTFI